MFRKSNNVVSVCCLYLSMVFPCIYCKYQVSTLENRSTTTSVNLKRQRLRYFSQNDRLALLSLFAFAGSYVWFLISASIKVRTRTEQDKDVSQDSCCFFSGFIISLALSAPTVFAGVQGLSRPLLNERQLFLFTILLSGSASSLSLSFSFYQCHLITQYTLDPGLREPNLTQKGHSPFCSSFRVV